MGRYPTTVGTAPAKHRRIGAMSALKSSGDHWGWPALVGMVIGIGAGFYFFWTGQLLRLAPHRSIEIITALGTLIGGAAAAIAAWVSFASSYEARRTSEIGLDAARKSAEATSAMAASHQKLADFEDRKERRKLDPTEWTRIFLVLSPKLGPCIGIEYDGEFDCPDFSVSWFASAFGRDTSPDSLEEITRGELGDLPGRLPHRYRCEMPLRPLVEEVNAALEAMPMKWRSDQDRFVVHFIARLALREDLPRKRKNFWLSFKGFSNGSYVQETNPAKFDFGVWLRNVGDEALYPPSRRLDAAE